ncbi:MAG TPA: hypothetical protein PLX74_10320, partial [Chitinophagaceae bacterium]|nr:hypothetical protein [Chitinophagaceae bacterium]
TYLLFEAHDTTAYIDGVKVQMDSQFESINKSSVYFIKKTLRKILRITNKFIRYSSSALVETELLLYFCSSVRALGSSIAGSTVIANLYQTQLKKINKAIASMHEDLQYDYLKELKQMSELN